MRTHCEWVLPIDPCIAAFESSEISGVMDALLFVEENDPDVHDCAVGIDLRKRCIEISINATGENLEMCVLKSIASIRQAVQRAGFPLATTQGLGSNQLGRLSFVPMS
ncbi:MAG: hypothetical protein PHN51_07300 [Candidatus Nanopelagicales bacterium]|nr:hypothetical protein [Candidatus Nanopelagicales bacterium]